MPKIKKEFEQEDVTKERVDHLIEHRIPWLVVGLLGGFVVTVVLSKYEQVLSADVRLAFFMPLIVYLSDAVGSQTETIYVRELSQKKIKIFKYILKESLIGMGLGLISGLLLGFLTSHWLSSPKLGLTIGVTMFINLTLAPILAVFIPNLLYRRHSDPALGAGPVATIIQDLISLVVYFLVADAIIF